MWRVRPGRAPSARGMLVAVLFAASIVGYADRQVIALLKPELARTLHWRESDYGAMTTAFQFCLAAALLGAGWFVDKVGVRTGFAAGLGGWSAAAVLHAACRSVGGFVAARAVLGGFEAVGSPAWVKAVTASFPRARHGAMLGLLNMAPNVAAMLTPLVFGGMFAALGWRWTVALIGGAGFLCLAAWLALPLRRLQRDAERMDAERGEAGPDAAGPDAAGPGPVAAPGPILRDRAAWAVGVTKLLSDQGWWFFLFWLPDFFHRRWGLDARHLGAPIAAIYALAAAGAWLGGSATDRLAAARPGGGRARARRTVMGAASLLVLPICVAPGVAGEWVAVGLVGLGLAAHQAFSTNVFAFAADWFGRERVGRAVSFGALCGNLGGTATLWIAGRVAGSPAGFRWMFLGCALGYPLAWVALQLLVPARTGGVSPAARPSAPRGARAR